MDETALQQTRTLRVGDTLVNASGHEYEVTKVARVGRGIRVQYVTAEGAAGRFTAAPDALVRVRAGSFPHVA